MNRIRFSVNNLYKYVIVFYLCLLFIGNTVQYQPSVYFLFGLAFVIVFFSYRKQDVYFYKQYLFLIVFVAYGSVVAIVNKGGFGGPITIITGFIVCYASTQVKFNKKDVAILVVPIMYSMIYWLRKSPTYYDVFFYNHWMGDSSLTNANGVGYYLCYECIYMFIILSLSKSVIVCLIKYSICVACLWGCYNVHARGALLSLVCFIIIDVLFFHVSKKKEIFLKILLLLSIVLEISFPFIYLALYNIGFGKEIKFFGLSEKGLYSGRQYIWLRAFDAFDNPINVLFGIGSRHDFWDEHVLNMHNNAMNLLVVVGVFGLFIYFSVLVKYIYKNFDFNDSSVCQYQCLIFFICVIIEGTTDVTLFYNNFSPYFFIPLGIALNKNYIRIDLDTIAEIM